MRKILFVIASIFAGTFSYAQEVDDSTKTTKLDELVVIGKTIKETPTGYKIQLKNKDIVNGKSVTETLGFLPNITVANGSILINGQAPSKITIDGRKVRNTEELSNLSGDFLDNVEISYVPDAGDVTNSSGGTIAIKLKKQSTTGYYGSVSGYLGAGIKVGPYREAVSPVVNAKTGNLSIYDWLYAGLYNHKDWATQTFESAISSESIHELHKDKNNQFLNTLNLNYEFNPRHSLALNWYYSFAKTGINDKNTDSGETLLDSRSPIRQNTVSLIYTGLLNNHGDRLNASLEWLNRNVEQTSQYSDNKAALTRDFQTQTTNLVQFQADYSRNITGSHTFTVGGNYLLTKERTGSDVDLTGTGAEWLKERVQTQASKVYVSMMGSFGKLSYYATLGWKHNAVKVFPEKARTQSSPAPTVRLSLPIKEQHSFSVQYSHILYDIEYDALSEKKRWLDGLSYFVGNPNLKAMTNDYIDLSGSLWNSRFNFSLGYSRIGNYTVWETFTEEGTNINYTKPINTKSQASYSFNIDYTQKLFGWWTLRPSLRLTLNEENGTVAGKHYKGRPLRQFYMVSNSFSFKNGWGGSATFHIEPTYHSFDHTLYTVYQLNCQIYKYFRNKTMMLSFDFYPVNRRRTYDRQSDQMLIRYKYTTPGQWGTLRFTWYFRGGKKDIKVNTKSTSLQFQESKSN